MSWSTTHLFFFFFFTHCLEQNRVEHWSEPTFFMSHVTSEANFLGGSVLVFFGCIFPKPWYLSSTCLQLQCCFIFWSERQQICADQNLNWYPCSPTSLVGPLWLTHLSWRGCKSQDLRFRVITKPSCSLWGYRTVCTNVQSKSIYYGEVCWKTRNSCSEKSKKTGKPMVMLPWILVQPSMVRSLSKPEVFPGQSRRIRMWLMGASWRSLC